MEKEKKIDTGYPNSHTEDKATPESEDAFLRRNNFSLDDGELIFKSVKNRKVSGSNEELPQNAEGEAQREKP